MKRARRFADLRAALGFLGFEEIAEAALGAGARGSVTAAGEVLVDTGDVEPAVRQLLAARAAARTAKNWAESDRIRDELAAMGVQLKDGKDPATGRPVTTWEMKR